MSGEPTLSQLIAEAATLAGAPHPCHILGHRWRFAGGAWCGCEGVDDQGHRWSGSCSVPVHRCEACGDYDYGNNATSAAIRAECGAVHG